MAGFVSSPPQAAAHAPRDLVAGDDFFPGLSLAHARESLRLSTVITDRRLRDAIIGGMITVRRELRSWKAAHVLAGAIGFEDIDSEEIDGELALELLYRRAVLAFAAADLVETHHDITASQEGRDRAEIRVVSADEHRRNGTHAIRDILGVPRTSVELI